MFFFSSLSLSLSLFFFFGHFLPRYDTELSFCSYFSFSCAGENEENEKNKWSFPSDWGGNCAQTALNSDTSILGYELQSVPKEVWSFISDDKITWYFSVNDKLLHRTSHFINFDREFASCVNQRRQRKQSIDLFWKHHKLIHLWNECWIRFRRMKAVAINALPFSRLITCLCHFNFQAHLQSMSRAKHASLRPLVPSTHSSVNNFFPSPVAHGTYWLFHWLQILSHTDCACC